MTRGKVALVPSDLLESDVVIDSRHVTIQALTEVSLPGPAADGRPSPTSPHPRRLRRHPLPSPAGRERGGGWGGEGCGQADTPRAEPSGRGLARSAQGGRFQSAE